MCHRLHCNQVTVEAAGNIAAGLPVVLIFPEAVIGLHQRFLFDRNKWEHLLDCVEMFFVSGNKEEQFEHKIMHQLSRWLHWLGSWCRP